MSEPLMRRLRALAATPSPVEWLLLVGSLVLTWRYVWLMDDAFIYFRYVDNLLFLGRGLVFNDGEYVEGFSSPLWTLLLIPLRALGAGYWELVRWSALGFALVFGWLAILVNRELSPEDAPRVNLPLAFLSAHYGVQSSFSSGLETPLVQLAAAVFALAALRPRSRVLLLAIGCAPLARPELALACVLFTLWWWWHEQRVPWLLLAAGAGFNGAWLLFRVAYYADLLPNTYYLKGAADWEQGVLYLRNVVESHHLGVLSVALLLAWFLLRRSLPSRGAARLAMVACAAVVLVWIVRIGGDMLYYRFLAFPTCLALLAAGGVAEAGMARLGARAARVVLAGALAFVTFGFSLWCKPHQLLEHPLVAERNGYWASISDAMWHRKHARLRYSVRNLELDAEMRAAYARLTDAERHHQGVLVHGFCRRAFVEHARYVVQEFGLTDPLLARLDAPFIRTGHKDLEGYAEELGELHRRYADARGRGMFRLAVEDQRAPAWIAGNLDAIEVLERKMYNEHDLFENLALAFTRVRRLELPGPGGGG